MTSDRFCAKPEMLISTSSYEKFLAFYSNFVLQIIVLCSFKNHEFILQKREIKVRNTQNGFVKPK